ncbi:MAG TPA: phytanoyl-CoA dioxygenase family protein [Alphaproteobacteria bacterium]|jgi:hypothetical protein|nr:phytanoyl-CoA dioxygenase family protein [Alphaproteobacteria bacterium]
MSYLKRLWRGARNLLLLPVWVIQLLTGAKSFADNPIIGSAALNRRGLHVHRLLLAHRLAAMRRRMLAGRVGAEDRAAFERDGVLIKPDFLPADLFRELLAEVKAHRGVGRETQQGDTVTRRIALDPKTLARLPAVEKAIGLPAFQGITRYVNSFDIEPMFYVQTILTHVRKGSPDPQLKLHSDAFQPSVKAWLFLTDVEERCAPFMYVPGSHKPTKARLAWEKAMSIAVSGEGERLSRRGSFRIDPAELPALGLPPPKSVAVKANTLVVADMFGFHARGVSDQPSMRVEIWAYGRHSPFVPWIFSPLWRSKATARNRVGAFWWWSDRLEKLGLKRNVWRLRQDVSAFDEKTEL